MDTGERLPLLNGNLPIDLRNKLAGLVNRVSMGQFKYTTATYDISHEPITEGIYDADKENWDSSIMVAKVVSSPVLTVPGTKYKLQ